MKRKLNEDFTAAVGALCRLPGGEALRHLTESLENDDPSVAIRINPLKEKSLPEGMRRVAWAADGVYVDGLRPRFTFDPAMHQGRYYVQDASSMVIGAIAGELAGDKPVIYIDSCAAPGGKTTAAISALPEGSLVIANEYDRRRAEALCENIIKWGYPDVAVTSCDTAGYTRLGPIADIVAADVPCSGEGMMRKETAAVEQWSPALVEQCAALQRSIIDNMWKALKPGGYFIYSTCTFNRTENEENVAYIAETLGGIPVDMHLSERFETIAPGIDTPYPAARFIPGRTEGEGLFVAVMRKPEDEAAASQRHDRRKESRQKEKHSSGAATTEAWIDGDDYELTTDGDRITALPKRWLTTINLLKKNLNVIYAGTEIAIVKGRDAIPSQALAASRLLRRETWAEAEVDYSTALQFLSRQAITLDDAPKGIILLTYDGHPLGFVKNLGNRANNLYPQAWAIRSTHLPDERPDVLKTEKS